MIPSVIVHYLDVYRSDFSPLEADSPLVVDADTVLALAITFQGLQVVAEWGLQKVQRLSSIELSKLALGNTQKRPESTRVLAFEDCQCVFALERLDHVASILRAA